MVVNTHLGSKYQLVSICYRRKYATIVANTHMNLSLSPSLSPSKSSNKIIEADINTRLAISTRQCSHTALYKITTKMR